MRGLEVEGTEPLEHEVAEMPSISIEGQADVPAPVSPGEAVSGTATPPTGHATPNKQQKKRRVQWSIADDDGQHDHGKSPARSSDSISAFPDAVHYRKPKAEVSIPKYNYTIFF